MLSMMAARRVALDDYDPCNAVLELLKDRPQIGPFGIMPARPTRGFPGARPRTIALKLSPRFTVQTFCQAWCAASALTPAARLHVELQKV
jgi:hypothetical protein